MSPKHAAAADKKYKEKIGKELEMLHFLFTQFYFELLVFYFITQNHHRFISPNQRTLKFQNKLLQILIQITSLVMESEMRILLVPVCN